MHRLKTYIVEDSPVIRDNLMATLEELVPLRGGGLWPPTSPRRHAVAAVPEHRAELVIVDIFLKAGSGLGVLRASRPAAPARSC
jgi:DNA-binding NarL/FixJ family response regulator